MHRFFLEKEDEILNGHVTLTNSETVRHLSRVLRVRVGEVVELVSSSGLYEAAVVDVTDRAIVLKIQSFRENINRNHFHLDLYQCLPKGQKLELILQKNVELGASGFMLVQSARCISDFRGKDTEKKLERFRRIVKEAAKQSKAPSIPSLEGIFHTNDVIDRIKSYDLFLVPYEAEGTHTLKAALEDFSDRLDGKRIGVIIGPEGGFEPYEVEQFQAAGAVVVTLGDRILRTETAGFTVTAWLQFYNS